jgi:hypothetical protein
VSWVSSVVVNFNSRNVRRLGPIRTQKKCHMLTHMISPSLTRVCTRAQDLKSEVVTARRRRYRGLQGGWKVGIADQDSSCSPGTPRRTKGEEPLLRVLIWRPATPPIILQLKCKQSDSHTAPAQLHALQTKYPWFQTSAAMLMRSALFYHITQVNVVILYRRFGAKFRSPFQWEIITRSWSRSVVPKRR